MVIDPKLGLMTENFNEIVSQYTKGLISLDSAKQLIDELSVTDGHGTTWKLDYNGALIHKSANQTQFSPADHIPEQLYYPQEETANTVPFLENNIPFEQQPATPVVQQPEPTNPTVTSQNFETEQTQRGTDKTKTDEPELITPNFSTKHTTNNPEPGEWISAEEVMAQASSWELPEKPESDPTDQTPDDGTFVYFEENSATTAKQSLTSKIHAPHITINLRLIITVLFAVGMIALIVLAILSTKNTNNTPQPNQPDQLAVSSEQLQQTLAQIQQTNTEQNPALLASILKSTEIKNTQVQTVEPVDSTTAQATLLITDNQDNTWTATILVERTADGQIVSQDITTLTKN